MMQPVNDAINRAYVPIPHEINGVPVLAFIPDPRSVTRPLEGGRGTALCQLAEDKFVVWTVWQTTVQTSEFSAAAVWCASNGDYYEPGVNAADGRSALQLALCRLARRTS